MALGCYLNINFLGAGVPWLIAFPLSGLIAGALGTMIALPVLRLHGVYLALATLAMSMLTSDFVVIAEPWTGGIAGAAVPDINIFGVEVNRYSTPYKFYYLVLFVAILLVWFYRNLLRTPTGRSFTAVRDSEISARAMGINLTRTKAMSFFPLRHGRRTCGGVVRPFRRLRHQRDIRSGHVHHFAADDRDWWIGLYPRRLLRGDCGWHHSGGHRKRAIVFGDHL